MAINDKRAATVPSELTEDIKKSRARLREHKPKVYEKLLAYLRAEEEGKEAAVSLIDFAFDFKCNLDCTHCCTAIMRDLPEQRGMSIQDVKVTADRADELGIGLDLQCATVSGAWSGNMEALIDEGDAEYLETLRKEYPLLRRDVWSTPGSKGGCPAATRSFYVVPSGDVLPCIFMHISFGNILKEPLSVIQERMLKVRELREFSPLCLVGEDRSFISCHLSKIFGKETLPADFREVFGEVIGSE